MDEVWKEISLGSLHQQVPSSPSVSVDHHHYPTTTTTFGGINLHDFFPGVFKEVNQAPTSSLGGSSFSNADPEPTGKSLSEQQPDMRARRKQRMIKNREAAARSKARKQAYKNELEREVDRLQKENRTLNSQREELLEVMASQNCMASYRKLRRTLTAPF